jgi:DnaJ like chaperone protein
MQWAGKALGGILGFFAAGPLGSMLGLVLGHQFDQGLGDRGTLARGHGSAQTRMLFFETSFAVMGNIAKSDGRVSEEEIRAARRVMYGMALSPEQVTQAIEHFTQGKGPDFRLTNAIDRLGNALAGRRDLKRAFIEIQLQALIASGGLDRAKRELLWRVARQLGMGRVELAQIEALVRAQQASAASSTRRFERDLNEAYEVLGVKPDAAAKDIKLAYRRLMSQHHPDKLVARGLPESMKANAEQKTREIRAAYDRIKAQRKLV